MDLMEIIDLHPPPPLVLSPLSSSSSASSRASTPLPPSDTTSPSHPFDLTSHTSEAPLPPPDKPTLLPSPLDPTHKPSAIPLTPSSSPSKPPSAPPPDPLLAFFSQLDDPARLHPCTFTDPSTLTSFNAFIADINRHSLTVDLHPRPPTPPPPPPPVNAETPAPVPPPSFLTLLSSRTPPPGPPPTALPNPTPAPSLPAPLTPFDDSQWKLQSRPSLRFCLKRSTAPPHTPSPQKKRTKRLDPLDFDPTVRPPPPTPTPTPLLSPPEAREARKAREYWVRQQAKEASDRARAQRVAAKRDALAKADVVVPAPAASPARVEVDADADVLGSAQRHSEALRLIPPAPLLTPTMEEFSDPMAYIQLHVNRYQDHGVVLIRPPEGWQPSYEYTMEGVTFACKKQVMKRYTDRHRKARQEVDPPPVPTRPHMDGTALQVSAFPFSDQMTMEEFRKEGGVRKGEWETLEKRWKRKQKKLNGLTATTLPAPPPNPALTPAPATASALVPSADSLPTPEPAPSTSDGSTSIPTTAPTTTATPPLLPAMVVPLLSAPEDAYWRWSMYYGRQPSVLYANDVDTHPSQRRPLPPSPLTPPLSPGSFHPWELSTLNRLPSGVLHYLDRVIPGITAPMLYIGMQFSTFCWHHEDHHLYSISFNHKGEPKTWYGVPGTHCGEVERIAASDLYPFFDHEKDHILARKTSMFSPVLLRERGVPVYRAEQREGMFVVTFPRAYHSGFSHGFSLAESVNFALDDWLEAGYDATQMYRNISKFPVVPYPELMMRVVEAVVGGGGYDGEGVERWKGKDVGMLMRVEEFFSKLVWDELVEREKVYGEGRQPKLRLCHQMGKRATAYCDLCSHATYFSVMRCGCKGVSLCLNHPVCRQHKVEGSRMRLAYSSLELITLISDVQSKLAKVKALGLREEGSAEEERQAQQRNGRFDACVALATALSDREAIAEDVEEEDEEEEEEPDGEEGKVSVMGRQMNGVAPEAIQVSEELQPTIQRPVSPSPESPLTPPLVGSPPVLSPPTTMTILATSSIPPPSLLPVVTVFVPSALSAKPTPVSLAPVNPVRRRVIPKVIPRVKPKFRFSQLLMELESSDKSRKV